MSLRAGLLAVAIALAPALSLAADPRAADKPNIVVVVVDGLGDVASPLGGADKVLPDPEIRARLTPNLDRLAKLGATFTNAQAVDTIKPPGVLSLGATVGSLPALLKAAGYTTAATGLPKDAQEGWDDVRPFAQKAIAPHRLEMGPATKELEIGWPLPTWGRLTPLDRRRKEDLSIEAWEELTESLDDQLAAAWAAERIATGDASSSQLVYVELPSPAVPYHGFVAPGVFYERFPVDQIVVPQANPTDLEDLPEGRWTKGRSSTAIDEDDRLAAVQAYLAAVSAADYALGKVVDAVEAVNSDDDPSNDWALVFVSKRGTPLGHKGVWAFSPWEAAAHTNLMLYAPGVTTPEQRLDTPVSLSDAAPTIAALVGVEPAPTTAADNLLPLFSTKGGWPGAVAVTTVGDGVRSIRSARFRLVHSADGEEELYDHDHDAEEFYNLLHPINSAVIEKFGMSDTQVEAVRDWLGQRLEEVLSKRKAPEPTQASDSNAPLPGDFNDDGSVDAGDSTVWRDNLGKEVPVGTAGDGDFDGRVEEDDRNVWLNNYGRKREPTDAE
jgi:arylsulfatase A-like enzyme